MENRKRISRRTFVRKTALAAATAAFVPAITGSCERSTELMKRRFGKIGFDVTTFGLGGQASLQWTPPDVDPVEIILKAFKSGVNYFDTSNLYGPSQLNFGKAFRSLNLIPGEPDYDLALRKSIFLTTKTHLRYAKGGGEEQGVFNWTNGDPSSRTIDDVRRSLTQMFGDGKGGYPEGAYLDMVLIHNLNTVEEVDALYQGYENPDPAAEKIGALAALRDFRDGTNLTGLNPRNEKLIKHIGFSGHFDPSVMMYMIRKDRKDLLDAMLVAINANDKLMFNMQYNVIPLASAKNMGIIAMKVFADGAMYSKPAEWSGNPGHVIRTVGDLSMPSHDLIKYSLTTPGVHLAIIGIGQISDSYYECQLRNNIDSAQVLPDSMSDEERQSIEKLASRVKDGKTNYFQNAGRPLTAPLLVTAEQVPGPGQRHVKISWSTAFAGDARLSRYEIWRDGKKITEIPFIPQITEELHSSQDVPGDNTEHEYKVRIIDAMGRVAETLPVKINEVS